MKPSLRTICFWFGAAVLSLLILETGLRLFGHVLDTANQLKNFTGKDDGTEIRIMTIGDSTTSDFFPGAVSWPRQLEETFRKVGYNVKVINTAKPGNTSLSIVQDLENNIRRWQPNLVVSMIGINDQPNVYSSVVESTTFWNSFRIVRLLRATKLFLTTVLKAKGNDYEDVVPAGFSFSNNATLVERISKNGFSDVAPEIEKNLATLTSEKDKGRYLAFLGSMVLRGSTSRKNGSELLERSFSYNKDILFVADNLAHTYFDLNESDKCFDVLSAYLERHKSNAERVLFSIFRCAGISANPEKWKDILDSVGLDLVVSNYSKNQITKLNYRYIADVLKKWSTPLIAMQYPRQDIEGLRDYFRDVESGPILPQYLDITFLSNAANFENALLQFGWTQVFQDSFAGYLEKPFGHATDLGNRLINESAYEGILNLLGKAKENESR